MKITMLNGLPITMLNGGGLGCGKNWNCNCNNGQSMGDLPSKGGAAALVLAGGLIALASLAKEKKKSAGMDGFALDVTKDVVGKVAIGAGVIAAGYFIVLRPILRKVGVVDTKEDKQAAVYATSAASPFNPQYYKGKPVTINKADAEKLAGQIYDAKTSFGWFGDDDEDALYAALRQMTTKNDVSWVADNFQARYHKDMYTYIRGFLNDSELAIVHGIVNGLR